MANVSALDDPNSGHRFAAGQMWSYQAAPGLETSRLIIGAIATFNGGRIYCCTIANAGRALRDGSIEAVHIPFLPMTEAALQSTVTRLHGTGELHPDFAARLDDWSNDPRGMSTFTVPFDGYLDRLISSQVAHITAGKAA